MDEPPSTGHPLRKRHGRSAGLAPAALWGSCCSKCHDIQKKVVPFDFFTSLLSTRNDESIDLHCAHRINNAKHLRQEPSLLLFICPHHILPLLHLQIQPHLGLGEECDTRLHLANVWHRHVYKSAYMYEWHFDVLKLHSKWFPFEREI